MLGIKTSYIQEHAGGLAQSGNPSTTLTIYILSHKASTSTNNTTAYCIISNTSNRFTAGTIHRAASTNNRADDQGRKRGARDTTAPGSTDQRDANNMLDTGI